MQLYCLICSNCSGRGGDVRLTPTSIDWGVNYFPVIHLQGHMKMQKNAAVLHNMHIDRRWIVAICLALWYDTPPRQTVDPNIWTPNTKYPRLTFSTHHFQWDHWCRETFYSVNLIERTKQLWSYSGKSGGNNLCAKNYFQTHLFLLQLFTPTVHANQFIRWWSLGSRLSKERKKQCWCWTFILSALLIYWAIS